MQIVMNAFTEADKLTGIELLLNEKRQRGEASDRVGDSRELNDDNSFNDKHYGSV